MVGNERWLHRTINILDIYLYLSLRIIIIYYALNNIIYNPVTIKRGKDRLYIADRARYCIVYARTHIYIYIGRSGSACYFLSETTTTTERTNGVYNIIYIYMIINIGRAQSSNTVTGDGKHNRVRC